ncbi:hypothetical protein K443DRAFT_187222 [Laccaria amethystina LaAM-08-1]|uniref:Uncharacterized protein n=1 Tax=Laccaria amethystina LaAM-08-1 TaxID=1095629 RepID=A0A0C9X5R5_9AGAR|nr:hypothetical protein K443DRAFT_187222 [Laccaria amethystina LaAM-08-1]
MKVQTLDTSASPHGPIVMHPLNATLFRGVSSSVLIYDGFKDEHAITAQQILAEVQSLMASKNSTSVALVYFRCKHICPSYFIGCLGRSFPRRRLGCTRRVDLNICLLAHLSRLSPMGLLVLEMLLSHSSSMKRFLICGVSITDLILSLLLFSEDF